MVKWPAPWPGLLGGEGAVLGLDEGAGDGEPDAAAGRVPAGGIGSVEPLEESFGVGGVEARDPVSVTLISTVVTSVGCRDGDLVAGVAVVQGVGQELVEDFAQAVGVGEDVPAGPSGVCKVTPARVYRAAAAAVARG